MRILVNVLTADGDARLPSESKTYKIMNWVMTKYTTQGNS